MFITPSFKKSLIVEQFQGNYLKGYKSELENFHVILFVNLSAISDNMMHYR